MKKPIQPHEKRKGWLKNSNPPGDFNKAPRCGAKTRAGTSCRSPAMLNGRCRLHGGKSTGAPIGNKNALKHGLYTKDEMETRKLLGQFLKECKITLAELDSD